MIEHLDQRSAVLMLQESFRVLRPGGRIRISTPDLKVLVGLLAEEKTPRQNQYIEFMARKFLPEVDDCKEVFVINNAFRVWDINSCMTGEHSALPWPEPGSKTSNFTTLVLARTKIYEGSNRMVA